MMEYGTSKESLLESILDVWKLFPDRSFGDILKMSVGEDVFYLTDEDLATEFKNFYLQNM